MNYGNAFRRMGVKNMGRLGAPWCGLNTAGNMVLMGHQNYFRRVDKGAWEYLDPGAPNEISHSSSARQSLNQLADYFQAGRQIFIIIGEFHTDGSSDHERVTSAAKFKDAPGGFFEAEMLEFDKNSGLIRCRCIRRCEM